MTTYGDMLYMLGGVPVGSGLGDVSLAGGNWYFCDPTHGTSTGNALTPQTANSSLLTCYNLTRDGYNDGVVFIGGATAWNPTAMLTWSNTYTHLIGTCPLPGVGQRCRIVAQAAAALTVPVTFSGDGCVIKNIQINNEKASGAAAGIAIVTAQRCVFENVFFMCPTSVTAAGYSLKVSGGENAFVRCTIGQHTLVRTAATYGLWILKGAGDCQRNKFIDCEILSWSSVTTHVPVKIATDIDVDNFTVTFENLMVSNIISGAGTLGHAIIDGATDAGHQVLLRGNLLVTGCTGLADPVTYVYSSACLPVNTYGLGINPAN